jgi:hypothetical protein
VKRDITRSGGVDGGAEATVVYHGISALSRPDMCGASPGSDQ